MISYSNVEILIILFAIVLVAVGLVAPFLPDLGVDFQSILGGSLSSSYCGCGEHCDRDKLSACNDRCKERDTQAGRTNCREQCRNRHCDYRCSSGCQNAGAGCKDNPSICVSGKPPEPRCKRVWSGETKCEKIEGKQVCKTVWAWRVKCK